MVVQPDWRREAAGFGSEAGAQGHDWKAQFANFQYTGKVDPKQLNAFDARREQRDGVKDTR